MTLDLYDLFVSELTGAIWIFIIIAIIGIFIMVMKFGIDYRIGIILSILFIGIVISYDYDLGYLWVIIVIITFLLLGREVKKLIEA
jgi:hypothetical protein